jgi:hypothetical protein
MQKTKKFIISLTISLAIFLMLVAPALSLAQFQGPCPEGTHNNGTACVSDQSGGLVPCDNSTGNLCDFNQLMNLVNKVISFILYGMAVPIAAIMFAYAGFLLVTAGGEAAGARTKAKSIFTNAVIGLLLAVAAFLIVRTILSILGYSGSWLGFNPF